MLTDWRTTGRLAELDPRDQILALNLLAGELRRALDGGDDPAAASTDAATLPLLGATLAELAQAHQAAGEPRQAATAAGELAQRMPSDGWPADEVDLLAQWDAAFAAYAFSAQSQTLALCDSVIRGFEAAGHRTGTSEQKNDLARVYSDRGAAQRGLGDLDAAIADNDAAIKLGETLRSALGAQRPPKMQNDLATFYSNRGLAHADRGDPATAIADYGAAIEFGETLRSALGDQWPPQMQNDLGSAYSNRGAAHADRGDLAAAIADDDAAIELGEALRSALGAQWPPQMRHDLAVVYLNLGAAYGQGNRLKEAITKFERGVAILRPLVATHPDVPEWRDVLEKAEQNLALARRLAAGDHGG